MVGNGSSSDAIAELDAFANALNATPAEESLRGIQNTMNDYHDIMVSWTEQNRSQVEVCDWFRALVAEYRPIRQEAVSFVVSIKDLADNAESMNIPVLLSALNNSDQSAVTETIHDMIVDYQEMYKWLLKLKDLHAEKILAISEQDERIAMTDTASGKLVATDTENKVPAAFGGLERVRSAPALTPRVFLPPEKITKLKQEVGKVTTRLEKQCGSVQQNIENLASWDSAEKIEHLLKAWSNEVHQASKLRCQKRLQDLSEEMAKLSQSCKEYLGNEAEAREAVLIAMNLTVAAKKTEGFRASVSNAFRGLVPFGKTKEGGGPTTGKNSEEEARTAEQDVAQKADIHRG